MIEDHHIISEGSVIEDGEKCLQDLDGLKGGRNIVERYRDYLSLIAL